MAKTLDFNTLKRPGLPLVLKDADKTRITVTTPTEGLVEELQAAAPELSRIYETRDAESIHAVYDLAARVISNNLSGLKVTVDELRGKYGLDIYDLLFFFQAYTDFISSISDAKN